MKITEVTYNLRSEYNQALKDFEHIFSYPLGKDDFFSIDHGADYFAFFDRLGSPHIYVAENDGRIIAVIVIVLREVDLYCDGCKQNIWYICDLKVHPDYRDGSFTREITKIAFEKYNTISDRIYGISMNTGNNTNRLIRFASRIGRLRLKLVAELNFYLLNFDQVNQLKDAIIRKYDVINFVSSSGIKDLIISSTNIALPVLYFSSRSNNITGGKFKDGYQCMFCFPKNSSTDSEFLCSGLYPAATASVLSNIKDCSWDFIEAHEI